MEKKQRYVYAPPNFVTSAPTMHDFE